MPTKSTPRPRSLTPAMVARALWWLDNSDAVAVLEAELRKDLKKDGVTVGRGRPRVVSVRALLLGLLLSVQVHRTLVLAHVHDVLTNALDLQMQQDLGLRWMHKGRVKLAQQSHVGSTLQAIHDALAHTDVYGHDVEPEERQRRQGVWQHVLSSLVSAAVPSVFERSGDYALDGCGLDSHGRPIHDNAVKDSLAAEVIAAGGEQAARTAGLLGRRVDWDARQGRRTRTRKKSQFYFGYDLQVLARLNKVGKPDGGPLLIEDFVLSPSMPSMDLVCLPMLDRLMSRGVPVKKLVVDRYYSFQDAQEWALELLERGVAQVSDYHAGEAMTSDYNGVRMVVGWPYCPGMPQELVDVPRPTRWTTSSTEVDPDAREQQAAVRAEIRAFEKAEDERKRYAMSRDQGWRKKDGVWRERYSCPAAGDAPKIRCPKRLPSLDLPMDEYPTVVNPPEVDLECCTKGAFNLPFVAMPKVRQPERWGSAEWRKDNGRRNAVELMFSNAQGPTCENIGPGSIQVFGLVKVGLLLACALAATNMRLSRHFAATHGMLDGRLPLLAPDPVDDRWIFDEEPTLAA